MTPATELLCDIARKADMTRWATYAWKSPQMAKWAAWAIKQGK